MAMKRVSFRGRTVNERTKFMLERAEARLGYELTIVQGSYNKGVGASAGTHDGGGAVDLAPYDWQRKIKVLRDLGFAAWYRPAIPGLWGAHIHAIAIGDPELHYTAKNQVTAYYNGRDGLANNGPDPHPRPSPIPVWPVPLGKVGLSRVQEQFTAKNPKPTGAVKKVQRMLNWRLAMDVAVDGVAGPQTREAYKRWERKINAPETDGIPGEFGMFKLCAGFYRVIVPKTPRKK